MKERLIKIFLMQLVLFVFLISCSEKKEHLIPSEYASWINKPENGFLQIKSIGQYEFSLQYRPVDFILVNEFRSDHIDKKEFESRKRKMEGLDYFSLKIKEKNNQSDVMLADLQDESEYFARDNYLSYSFNENISMINGDTLECSVYHFVNTHGLTPYVEIVFGFENKNQKKGDKTIIIDDVVFGSGIIKFHYAESILNNEPILEL